MNNEFVKQTDFDRLEHLLAETNQGLAEVTTQIAGMNQRLNEAISQQPRFDWKWFIGVTVPIIFTLIAGFVIGYFGIKADLRVFQNEVKHLSTDVAQIRETQKVHSKAIAGLETSSNNLQNEVRRLSADVAQIQKTQAEHSKSIANLEGDSKVIKHALGIKP